MIPPVFTRWNRQQRTIAYLSMKAGRNLDEVLKIGGPDPYGGPNPVTQSATTLRELQVFPQPLQRPHPQPWEPLTTGRSIQWAAERRVIFVIAIGRSRPRLASLPRSGNLTDAPYGLFGARHHTLDDLRA